MAMTRIKNEKGIGKILDLNHWNDVQYWVGISGEETK